MKRIFNRFFSDMNIFLKESFVGRAGFVLVLILLCGILTAVEKHRQISDVPWGSVLRENLLYFASMGALLFTFEFICFWRSSWLGGDTQSIILSTILSAVILYAEKSLIFTRLGMRFQHQVLMTGLPLLILLTPIALFMLFILMLGSKWTN